MCALIDPVKYIVAHPAVRYRDQRSTELTLHPVFFKMHITFTFLIDLPQNKAAILIFSEGKMEICIILKFKISYLD